MRIVGSISLLIALLTSSFTFTAEDSAPASWHGAAPIPGAPDGSWRQGDVWNDGKAEFSVYEVKWPRYGHGNPGRALMILVKEPWSPEPDVKADRPGPDSFDVIKLNHVRTVRTGIYVYHQMASVFVRRDDGRLRKIAASSAEACGLTTSDMTRDELRTRSYFDGQADRRTKWPTGALPEDGLPMHLRDFVAGTPPATLEIFPTLLAGSQPPLRPDTYRVTRRDRPALAVPAGAFDCVEITLTGERRTLTYAFEKASPHRLLELRHSDGTEYRLAKSERLPYWTMNRPGGEKWLPENLR